MDRHVHFEGYNEHQQPRIGKRLRCAVSMLTRGGTRYCKGRNHSACLKTCAELTIKCPETVRLLESQYTSDSDSDSSEDDDIEDLNEIAHEALKLSRKTEKASEKCSNAMLKTQGDLVKTFKLSFLCSLRAIFLVLGPCQRLLQFKN